MIDRALSLIAPHHCLVCDEPGRIICQCCQNYIEDEPFSTCLVCNQPTQADNLCPSHPTPYQKAWCVTERSGATKELIDAFKFQRAKSAYEPLASLLSGRLPDLPDNTLIVPVPTTPSNIRIRGYDHMLLVARELAKVRGLSMIPILGRNNNTTQHFAENATERRKQAVDFFNIKHPVKPNFCYLVIDDIFTTGSTVGAAADSLRSAGASNVWIAVVSRQVQS